MPTITTTVEAMIVAVVEVVVDAVADVVTIRMTIGEAEAVEAEVTTIKVKEEAAEVVAEVQASRSVQERPTITKLLLKLTLESLWLMMKRFLNSHSSQ